MWDSLIMSWSRTWDREDVSWTFVPLLSATHGFSPKIDGLCSSAEVTSSPPPLLLVQTDT